MSTAWPPAATFSASSSMASRILVGLEVGGATTRRCTPRSSSSFTRSSDSRRGDHTIVVISMASPSRPWSAASRLHDARTGGGARRRCPWPGRTRCRGGRPAGRRPRCGRRRRSAPSPPVGCGREMTLGEVDVAARGSSARSWLHSACMASQYSSVRRAPVGERDARAPGTPRPASRRRCRARSGRRDSWSSVAHSLASTRGLRWGTIRIPVARRILLVDRGRVGQPERAGRAGRDPRRRGSCRSRVYGYCDW